MSLNGDSRACRIYCAGPLFNGSERKEMTAIADALDRAGYRVYLPHRDGMEFRRVLDILVEREWPRETAAAFLHAAIFALDVYQLAIECDAVVWNVNGRTPDEGAVAEAAIAWTLGKPLIAYSDDVRTLIEGRMNPLLWGMVDFARVQRFAEIPSALADALERHGEVSAPAIDKLSAKLRQAVEDGRRLWEALCSENAQNDDEAIATVVANLFAPTEVNRAKP